MYLNTDELLLLSRGGRVPPVSRAGPRYRDWLAPHEREGLRVVRSWGLRSARRRRAAQLRKALGQLGSAVNKLLEDIEQRGARLLARIDRDVA